MSCKYYEEREFICGWKDNDTPYYYKSGVCMGQKGAPCVGCKGDEDQCENLDPGALSDKWNGERRSNMDAVKFITTMARICAVDHCRDCALDFYCTKLCCERTEDDAEKAMAIVEKWLKDHPPKTRQSELLKMFPNTPVDCNSGVITMCPASFDASACKQGVSCDDCFREFWLEEVK